MSNLQKDIQDQIAAHLPQATAGALRDYMDKAEIVKKSNERLVKEKNDLQRIVETKSESIHKLEALVKKDEALSARERDLDVKEAGLNEEKRVLELSTLQIKLDMTIDKTTCLENMMNTVFRNQTVNKMIMTERPYVMKDQYNNGGETMNTHFSSDTETTTVD
jgi:hypothetical protein